MQSTATRWLAAGTLLVVLAAACTAPESEVAEQISLGSGVTDAPCPGVTDQERGCIYLGVLADLTDGPFGPLGVEVVSGVRDFWHEVNADGGIGRFDVDVDTYVRDTAYDPDTHVAAFAEIADDVVGLALSFGTPTTEALAPELADHSMMTVPFSWWSGLDREPVADVLLRSGASYCAATELTLGWMAEQDRPPASVMVVGYAGAYADDAEAGAQLWAQAADADYLGTVTTQSNAEVGTQADAVANILDADPDVVVLALGPPETTDLVGTAVMDGYRGRFVGLVPTWDPALLATDSAGALTAMFRYATPWEGYSGDSDAHEAMRAAHGAQVPENGGYTAGWISSYPLLAVLEAAHDEGRLTRAGLRQAADGVEVSYDGALPSHVLGSGSPDAYATAVLARPDAEAPTGLTVFATAVRAEDSRAAACTD